MIEPERIKAIGELLSAIRMELPGFTRRRSQDRMIRGITSVLEGPDGTPKIAAVEAPTGVGKSFGYLIPALLSAQAHGKKLLIATATVALQQQVISDVAVVLRASGLDLESTVVKGRSRYLCDRNARLLSGTDPDQSVLDFGAGAAEEPMESPHWPFAPTPAERDATVAMVDGRRSGTWDGDLDTWDSPGATPRLRAALTTSTSGCAGAACPMVARCPVMTAKARTWTADVLVTNLAVLLTDLAMGGGALLPSVADCVVVIDEAHHLPEAAVSAFAASMSLGDHGKRLKGVERATSEAMRGLGTSSVSPATMAKVSDGLRDLRSGLSDLSNALLPLLESRPDTGPRRIPTYGQPTVRRLVSGDLEPLWDTFECVRAASSSLGRAVEKIRRKAVESGGPREAALVRDLGVAEEWLDGVRRASKLAQSDPDAEVPAATWLERSAGGEVVFHAAPVEASGILASALWSQCHGAILTSATLSTFGTFDHFSRSTGLSRIDGVSYASLPSPFDLERAAVLSVPAMRTTPADTQAYIAEVVEELAKRVDVREGTLVLFASGALMRAVYDQLPASLRDITAKQGDAPVQVLLDAHRSVLDSGTGHTLFGLATLAEGVDLVGAYNAHTVIVKLPFPSPDDPVMATHAEWLESRGVNPFGALFLPAVFRKLVQSCGRLIRSETDRGRITILDHRLLTKPYGRRLLEHLPPYRRDIGSTHTERAA